MMHGKNFKRMKEINKYKGEIMNVGIVFQNNIKNTILILFNMSTSSSSQKKYINTKKLNLYSTYRRPKVIQYATMRLLESNFPNLVHYIYSHRNSEIFDDPETRVGICIKLLHSLDMRYDEQLLQPILDDIEFLMDSESHLASTEDPERRIKCLEEEFRHVQKYIDMDDTISLNTEIPAHIIKDSQTPNKKNNYDEFQDDQCIIQ